MYTENYKEVLYTIEVDWKGGTVWLNNHVSKEKIVLTYKDFEGIKSDFKLLDARAKGLI